MASRMGHVLLINADDDLVALADAAAKVSYCHLTVVSGLDSASKLVVKKQFDLILLDPGAPDGASFQRFFDLV